MDTIQIGRFIAECRKEKGLTQEELAEKLGVTNRSISRWENGKTLPDYSLIESICRELGITICELFAAQHARPQNQAVLADYSMNQIFKEYTRMKNQRKVLGIILIIAVCILLARILLSGLVLTGVMAFELLAPTKRQEGVEKYDKAAYLEKYGGDLGSTLMIFPDSLDGKKEITFKSALKTGLFDTDGFILLECSMDPAEFEKEIKRLSSIQATVYFHEEEPVTNSIIYDEEIYPYPAYIASDGFDSTYEYALVDQEANRIIYLYISMPVITNLNYAKYLKKDLLAYTKAGMDSYSLYYHTFDGGQSYIFYRE